MPAQRILVVDDSPTIRKVVEGALLRAGYSVQLATDGQDALERVQQSPPDLVLLDFVMPRMNGYEFLKAVRGIDNLRRLLVVVMSAKGDRVGEQFITQMGAADAITKPFTPDTIVSVVGHVLERARTGTLSERPSAAPAAATDRSADAALEREVAARTAAARVGETVARLLSGQLPDLAGRVSEIASAVATALDAEAIGALAADLRRLEPGLPGEDVLKARIDRVGLGEILQMLHLQKQTGVLVASLGEVEVTISLRDGLIDLATARGGPNEFLLGRYLLEEDLMSRQDLEPLLKNKGTSRRLLGDQLVKAGYISAADLARVLERQTSELVYEALRWYRGEVVFRAGATRPEAQAARLGLHVAGILLEGFRRVDEWRLIEQEIENLDRVFVRHEDTIGDLSSSQMTRDELLVLDAVNGHRTARDIIDHTKMSSFDVCKILYQLLGSRLISKRGSIAADRVSAPPAEA